MKYWTRVTKGAKAGMTQTGGSHIERVLEHRTPAAVQTRDGKTNNTKRTESKTYSHLEGADDFEGADEFSAKDTLQPIFSGGRWVRLKLPRPAFRHGEGGNSWFWPQTIEMAKMAPGDVFSTRLRR